MSVALVACQKVEQGVLQPIPPLAGLRYVNLVNDTSAVDFRIINFIGDAPSAGLATFRTGGAVYGVSSTYLPLHWPVEANREVNIRVFMNGSTPETASQRVFDTTCTFAEGVNYTFFLYGSARGANVHALVSVDSVSAPASGKIKVRVLNLARSLAGADSLLTAVPAVVDTTSLVDAWIRNAGVAAPFSGTTPHLAIPFGTATAYQELDSNSYYRLALTARGTTSPIILQAGLTRGVRGSSTSNPVSGAAVAGTAITAVIVPRSVAPSPAPQTGAPATKNAQAGGVFRSNDTVTFQTAVTRSLQRRSVGGLPLPGDTIRSGDTTIVISIKTDQTVAAGAGGTTHGIARGDNVFVSGATQPDYNGWQAVMAVADTIYCVMQDSLVDTRRDIVNAAGVVCPTLLPTLRTRADSLAAPRNVIVTTRSRFRYRTTATPTSPATGAPKFGLYPLQTAPNFRVPFVIFLTDRRADLTAP